MNLIECEIKKLKNNKYEDIDRPILNFIKLTTEYKDNTLTYFEFLITKLELFDSNINYQLTILTDVNVENLSLECTKRILSSILFYSTKNDKAIFKKNLQEGKIHLLLKNLLKNNTRTNNNPNLNNIRKLHKIRRKIRQYTKTREYKIIKNQYVIALKNNENIDYVLSNLEMTHNGIINLESELRNIVSKYDLWDRNVNIHFKQIVEKYGNKIYFTDYIDEKLTEEEILTILTSILRDDRFHRQGNVSVMENILNGNLLKLLSKIKIPIDESKPVLY